MLKRAEEFFIALIIYVISMTVLLMIVYQFLENWHLSEFNFFIAGALVLLIALGWGYVLTAIIFVPQKQMEDTLASLTHDIIHELNIPLSTIKANTSMLRKSMEDSKSLKRIERIDAASERLKRLYDELVYSINKEIQPIEKERFDVASLVRERVSFFEEQKRNIFILDLHFYEILGDKIGFEQMLDNLISNAMKYSPKESTITISLKKNILLIEDNGIGMTDTELLRIHERYYQADMKKEGEGIGLALVKAYCEEESIDIQIYSKKNQGTKVSLELEKSHKRIV